MTLTLSPIVHALGARQPPLYGKILSDGAPVNLTGSTVTFYMRPVNSSTLKVAGGAATVDGATTGDVHYSWAAADVDTVGSYVGWWRVTTAGAQYEETPEFGILISAHAPGAGGEYVSASELKQALGVSDSTFADPDVQRAVEAAKLAIDQRTGRSFTLGAPGEVRTFYTPAEAYAAIDDLNTLTAVTVNGVAITLGTHFRTEPGSFGWPISTLIALPGYVFPTKTAPIAVTGTWGWSSIPADVKSAALIIAARVLKRTREATFGVAGFGFEGAAVHIARYDPDLDMLLGPYERSGGSLAQG